MFYSYNTISGKKSGEKKNTLWSSTQGVNPNHWAKPFPHQRSPKRHPSISLIPLIMFRPDVKAKRVSLSLFCGEVWKVFAGFLWGLCSWNTQGGSKKDREIAHKRWRDGAQKICVKTEQWWTACHCCNEPLLDSKHTKPNKEPISDNAVLPHNWQNDGARMSVLFYICLLYSMPFCITVSSVEYRKLCALNSCSFPYLVEWVRPDRNGQDGRCSSFVYLCLKYFWYYVKSNFWILVFNLLATQNKNTLCISLHWKMTNSFV